MMLSDDYLLWCRHLACSISCAGWKPAPQKIDFLPFRHYMDVFDIEDETAETLVEDAEKFLVRIKGFLEAKGIAVEWKIGLD